MGTGGDKERGGERERGSERVDGLVADLMEVGGSTIVVKQSPTGTYLKGCRGRRNLTASQRLLPKLVELSRLRGHLRQSRFECVLATERGLELRLELADCPLRVSVTSLVPLELGLRGVGGGLKLIKPLDLDLSEHFVEDCPDLEARVWVVTGVMDSGWSRSALLSPSYASAPVSTHHGHHHAVYASFVHPPRRAFSSRWLPPPCSWSFEPRTLRENPSPSSFELGVPAFVARVSPWPRPPLAPPRPRALRWPLNARPRSLQWCARTPPQSG